MTGQKKLAQCILTTHTQAMWDQRPAALLTPTHWIVCIDNKYLLCRGVKPNKICTARAHKSCMGWALRAAAITRSLLHAPHRNTPKMITTCSHKNCVKLSPTEAFLEDGMHSIIQDTFQVKNWHYRGMCSKPGRKSSEYHGFATLCHKTARNSTGTQPSTAQHSTAQLTTTSLWTLEWDEDLEHGPSL